MWISALLLLAHQVVAEPAPLSRPRVLVMNIKADDIDKATLENLTDLVATHIAKDVRYSVVSGSDMRRILELESNKESAGCDDASVASCMADLAGALGATYVVFGNSAKLGNDLMNLNLQVYDSKQGQVLRRIALQGKNLADITPQLDTAVVELGFSPNAVIESKGTSILPMVLVVSGAIVVVAGLASVAVGFYQVRRLTALEKDYRSDSTTADKSLKEAKQVQQFFVAGVSIPIVAGAAAVAAGAGLIVAGALGTDEE
jgi:Protein of unknown function (DUF2380)